jgi:hypothetical protein
MPIEEPDGGWPEDCRSSSGGVMRVESSESRFSRDVAPVGRETPQTLTATVASASKQAAISVVTTEGDRVTISARESTTVAFAGYGADGRVTSGVGYVGSSMSASISVEGDLNRRELRDLRKVLHAVSRAVDSGNAERLAHRLSRPDLSSIESVGASVSFQQFAVARTAPVPSAETPPVPTSPEPGDGASAEEITAL